MWLLGSVVADEAPSDTSTATPGDSSPDTYRMVSSIVRWIFRFVFDDVALRSEIGFLSCLRQIRKSENQVPVRRASCQLRLLRRPGLGNVAHSCQI